MLKAIFPALYFGITDFAYFIAFEVWPFHAIKLFIKEFNMREMEEINEGIPNIALVAKIHWEIKEIVSITEIFVNKLKKHFLGVFVRYVFDHNCCPLTFLYIICFNVIILAAAIDGIPFSDISGLFNTFSELLDQFTIANSFSGIICCDMR